MVRIYDFILTKRQNIEYFIRNCFFLNVKIKKKGCQNLGFDTPFFGFAALKQRL